jgi:catechol 2,3-dioxygenase
MIGAVRLRVADRDRVQRYYEDVIGLHELERDGVVVRLGADTPLVDLVADPDAPPRPARSTGLFHLAVLVPARADLARAMQRVAAAGGRFSGASDHFVSEALYLSDPEGYGIEIYRDRPRAEWEYEPSGELRMGTVALDLDGVLGELPGGADEGMPAGTVIGHVHLQVADVAPARAFYAGDLGLDVTVSSYPGALFLSSGGYHHHVGINTWASAGAPPPPAGSRGLEWFELRTGAPGEVADPSGNRIRLS